MVFLRVTSLLKITLRSFSKKVEVQTMRYLNVAEKNDAAKNIAAILSRGASTRREGLSVYNKIYEFDATIFGRPVNMIMTSVSGHLLAYEFSAQFRNWNSCNPVSLFDAPVINNCIEGYSKIKRTLEREIRSCQGLIIWTDCDREGENIGFEIIKVCKDIKPNISVYRAKFSEITNASIFRALNNLGQPNKNISDAVDVRKELDLRTGAAFTRLQTLRLKQVFPEKLAEKLISYGSCQFPTLGFVVERYKAIEEFIPEAFWKIKMNHTVGDITTDFTWKRDRLFDKNACEGILDICKENSLAKVESVESKPKNKWRPVPLDTVEMEKTVSKKLKINAKDCMKIAEKLYTQGLISYPRTETNIFPKELNLTNLVQMQSENQQWGQFAQRILNEGGPTPRQGKKSDQAHPPIHPTKYTNSLNGNEARVYEYIVRHFLACVQKDAKGFETTVNVDIANEKFTAKGLLILEKNYLEVYVYEKWNAKEINIYQVDDTFNPTVLEMAEGTTTAPQLLTEADLIALMEKHGIGTDATHAEHIDKIKSREYVGLHENIYFVPGTLGMGLVEGYNNIGLEVSLAKPILRAEFENDLKLICEGRKDPEQVRQEQIAKYRAVFQTVVEKMIEIDRSLAARLNDEPQQVPDAVITNDNDFKSVLKCPKCGRDMLLRNRNNGNGMYMSCTGYPECKNAIWFINSIDTIQILDESCNICGPDVKKLKIKFKQNLFPGQPNPNVLCIGGCNVDVLETLNINISSVKRSNTDAPTQNNRTNNVNNWDVNNWVANNNAPQNRQNNTNQSRNNSDSGYNTFSSNTNRNNGTAQFNSNLGQNRNSVDLLPKPSTSNRNSNSFDNTNTDVTVCSCNKDALLLTVRKEGINKGRKFYKCPDRVCDFFLWAPDDATASSSNVNTSGFNATVMQPSQNTVIMCNCNQPAVERIVTKENENKGRRFYCCSKPMGERCNFFKWSDEVVNGGNNDWNDGGGGGGNSSRQTKHKKNTNKRPAPYKNQTKGKRKCGICGEEGHTRAKCPNT